MNVLFMHPYAAQTLKDQPNRKHQQFWAVTEWHEVRRVTGFDCGENYKGEIWWVPELGYSMTLGTHLFEDKRMALLRAKAEVRVQMEQLEKAMKRLNERIEKAKF